jgi:hypothetical protein
VVWPRLASPVTVSPVLPVRLRLRRPWEHRPTMETSKWQSSSKVKVVSKRPVRVPVHTGHVPELKHRWQPVLSPLHLTCSLVSQGFAGVVGGRDKATLEAWHSLHAERNRCTAATPSMTANDIVRGVRVHEIKCISLSFSTYRIKLGTQPSVW